MNNKNNYRPTDAELEILVILWEKGPSTVRDVNEAANLRKKVGYTTTLKLLQIMTEKGLAVRDENNRTHVYSAAVSRDEAQNLLLDRLLVSTFGGSASRMVMQLLGNHPPDDKELEEIKRLINELQKGDDTDIK